MGYLVGTARLLLQTRSKPVNGERGIAILPRRHCCRRQFADSPESCFKVAGEIWDWEKVKADWLDSHRKKGPLK